MSKTPARGTEQKGASKKKVSFQSKAGLQSHLASHVFSLSGEREMALTPLDPAIGIRRKRMGAAEPYFVSTLGLTREAVVSELILMGFKVSEVDSLELHLANIPPGKKLAAHFHARGDEVYFIISGQGIMKLGHPEREDGGFFCDFSKGQAVQLQPEQTLTVKALEVHCPINPDLAEDLYLAFICPADHLDNNKNRTFVKVTE